MRYFIRSSLRSSSSSERDGAGSELPAGTQKRGQILASLFLLSLLTTFWSLFQFHVVGSPFNTDKKPKHNVNSDAGVGGRRGGILQFDYAANAFRILKEDGGNVTQDGISLGQQSQLFRSLRRKYSRESGQLQWHLRRGSVKSSADTSEEDFLGDFVHLLLHKDVKGTGFYMEYFPIGWKFLDGHSNSTRRLEMKYGWKGVVFSPNQSSTLVEKLISTRSENSFVCSGIRICAHSVVSQSKTTLSPKNSSEDSKMEVDPVPAPPTREPGSLEKNIGEDANNETRDGIKDKMSPSSLNFRSKFRMEESAHEDDENTTTSVMKAKPKSSPVLILKKTQKIPCFTLFSLAEFFHTFQIDLFIVHIESREQMTRLLYAILQHWQVIQIKILSILPSPEFQHHNLPLLGNKLKGFGYSHFSFPLGRPRKLESIRNGTVKVNGQLSKAMMLRKVYRDDHETPKQHVFVLSTVGDIQEVEDCLVKVIPYRKIFIRFHIPH